ncbi:VOC family protein [Patescibacteria group bacterium]|nr:VOC family protein [Patescibacteria group bacterium]
MIKRIHSTLFQVKDFDKTAEFYKNLGFDIQKSNDTIRIIFGNYRFAFIKEKDEVKNSVESKGTGISIFFEVDNIDNYYQALQAKSITLSSEPKDQPWGKRELMVTDPDGYKLVFFSNI